MSRDVYPLIFNPDFYTPGSRIQGVKKAQDPLDRILQHSFFPKKSKFRHSEVLSFAKISPVKSL